MVTALAPSALMPVLICKQLAAVGEPQDHRPPPWIRARTLGEQTQVLGLGAEFNDDLVGRIHPWLSLSSPTTAKVAGQFRMRRRTC